MNGTISDGETEPGAASLAFSGATHAIKGFEDFGFGEDFPFEIMNGSEMGRSQTICCNKVLSSRGGSNVPLTDLGQAKKWKPSYEPGTI
jgi:hypothetical protein